ncbi:CRISPR-associated helicase Cas3' [Paracoccus sp. WLY502]|uniref:CRISPR-associated helicase Cas3' n=1 Tax=Paracoccus yibinensis TaxID=3068891 RepID=UPI002796C9E3|nr:CRISPR-associated helicase Cas3' [Paracoccus sp. WLY502]MDQ1899654.1 CRISPR-associated helicase Cas3' [Paracoccus sp. WLY502]
MNFQKQDLTSGKPNAWGKASAQGEFHALEAHSMDVAAVFEALCRLPVIARHLQVAAGRALAGGDMARMAALVYLHDLGKLEPGFQAKARPELACPADVNHSVHGVLSLTRAFQKTSDPLCPIADRLGSWGEGVEELMMAIFAHHGRPVEAPATFGKTFDVAGYDRKGAVADYLRLWTLAWADLEGGPPLPARPELVHLVAGLAALADWIGSDRRFFDFVADPGPDYPAKARQAAQNALRKIGLDTGTARPATDFASVAGAQFAPRAAQRLVGRADPDSALVLLEAETGSGKTEAALWRYALLHAAGLVSGLYFAVPTRAAARQLHRRVNEAMKRLFGSDAPEAVLAVPGQLLSGEATGQRLPGFETRWDDADGTQPARWAAEHATRYLAASVAVGTVDQALLAGLQVKHAHLRGAALSRSLLVVDEVHSSDAYMTEILAELLEGHLAAGGHAMLMSATLGSRARSRLLQLPLPALADAIAAPYPALWSRGTGTPDTEPADGRAKAVAMTAHPTMDPSETARLAVAAARQGARVLVIRNTVSAACATFDAVVAAGGSDLLLQVAGGPALHHSRFAAEDRHALDRAVEAVLAPDRERQFMGAIVIGSQTLEQSLDICADHLITDLCPVDVLLQRLGRLHRHDLPRPAGFEDPRCLVLCPEDGLDPLTKPAFVNGLGAWKPADGSIQGIYLDLACLSLTEDLIASKPVWHVPAMNRELVECATHPDAQATEIARRGAAWTDYQTSTIGRDISQRGQARNWLLRRSERFPERLPGKDEIVQTRLGSAGPLIRFAPGTVGPFGSQITQMTIPAHWRGIAVPDTPVATEIVEGGMRFDLGEVTLFYGRSGLVRQADIDA